MQRKPLSKFTNPNIPQECITQLPLLKYVVDILSFRYEFSKFILFLAVLGLRCCARALSSCGEQGLLPICGTGLLIAMASLVVAHRLQVHGLQSLWCGDP